MEMEQVAVWSTTKSVEQEEVSVYQHTWQPKMCLKQPHQLLWKVGQKATNPPQVISYYEELVTTSVHCDDGWYVIPTDYLGDGILSGIQYRELIGIHSA